VRPCKQLGNGGCSVGERFRINQAGLQRHTTRTMGGLALGSSNSMLTVLWLIWADAKGVMG